MTEKKIPHICPVCGSSLRISRLSCPECGTEIVADFPLNEKLVLDDADLSFIKLFLAREGNMSKMQSELSLTYGELKNKLSIINQKVGNETFQVSPQSLASLNDVKNDGPVVRRLKKKMKECGGKSRMFMLRGDPIPIYLAPDGSGIIADSYRNLVMKWDIFEAIVNKANSFGGDMVRGDMAAQSGAKLGSESLSLDTIDGFISIHYYGAKVGDSTLRRSTYYAAVLSWADIVSNNRSHGRGGFIKVNEPFQAKKDKTHS